MADFDKREEGQFEPKNDVQRDLPRYEKDLQFVLSEVGNVHAMMAAGATDPMLPEATREICAAQALKIGEVLGGAGRHMRDAWKASLGGVNEELLGSASMLVDGGKLDEAAKVLDLANKAIGDALAITVEKNESPSEASQELGTISTGLQTIESGLSAIAKTLDEAKTPEERAEALAKKIELLTEQKTLQTKRTELEETLNAEQQAALDANKLGETSAATGITEVSEILGAIAGYETIGTSEERGALIVADGVMSVASTMNNALGAVKDSLAAHAATMTATDPEGAAALLQRVIELKGAQAAIGESVSMPIVSYGDLRKSFEANVEQASKINNAYHSIYAGKSGYSSGEMESADTYAGYMQKPGKEWRIVPAFATNGQIVGGLHYNIKELDGGQVIIVEQAWARTDLSESAQKEIFAQHVKKIEELSAERGMPVIFEAKEAQIALLPSSARVIDFPYEQSPFDEGDDAVGGLKLVLLAGHDPEAKTANGDSVFGFVKAYHDWVEWTEPALERMEKAAAGKELGLLSPAEYASKQASAALSPITADTVNLREIADTLTERDFKAIKNLIKKDEHLDDQDAIDASRLSPGAKKLATELSQFAKIYYAQFPDETETEKLTALVDYLADRDKFWTIMSVKGEDGKTTSFASGRITCQMNAESSIGDAKVGWFEHWATEGELQRQGRGAISRAELENVTKCGVMVLEVDRPNMNLDPSDPANAAAFNHADPEARTAAWIANDHRMDPFRRLEMHGRYGYNVAVSRDAEGKIVVFPYSQIDMTPDEFGGGCETLVFTPRIVDDATREKVYGAIAGVDPKLLPDCPASDLVGVMSKQDVQHIIEEMQKTIDDPDAYPEYKRMLAAQENVGNEVFLVKADSPFIRDLLSQPVEVDTVGNLVTDLKNCGVELDILGTPTDKEGKELRTKVNHFVTRSLLKLGDEAKDLGDAEKKAFWSDVAARLGMDEKLLANKVAIAEKKRPKEEEEKLAANA